MNTYFQVGYSYKHTSGKIVTIVGTADTFFHGECLIGEDNNGNLSPHNTGKTAFTNWHQITIKSTAKMIGAMKQ